MTPRSYHSSNLLLIALETMRLLVLKNNLSNRIITDIFETRNLNYNLSSQTDFIRTLVNTSGFGLNSIKYLATKIWNIVLYDIKSVKNLNSFKKKIRNWKLKGCYCRLCKQHDRGAGYVDIF